MRSRRSSSGQLEALTGPRPRRVAEVQPARSAAETETPGTVDSFRGPATSPTQGDLQWRPASTTCSTGASSASSNRKRDGKAIVVVQGPIALLTNRLSVRILFEEPNCLTTNSLPFWLTARRHGLAGNGQYCAKAPLSSLPGLPVGLPNWHARAFQRCASQSLLLGCAFG